MKLTKKHRNAIEMLLAGDLTKVEIAERVKISRKTLYNWLADEDFKAEMTEREDDYRRMIRARLACMSNKALDTQVDIMDNSDDDKARATVSSDVLDRAGYLKPKNTEDVTPEGTGVIILAEVKENGS